MRPNTVARRFQPKTPESFGWLRAGPASPLCADRGHHLHVVGDMVYTSSDEGGRIAESRAVFDSPAFRQQLGLP